jgi:ElaB/YqjD/DUF883 family membrane-anchored ribosome-binding protein
MAPESLEHMTDAADTTARRAMGAAQDMTDRAGSYVQHQFARLSGQAQDLARGANERMRDYAGRPLDAWVADTRAYVRAHPLQSLAVTIGIGYILGKLMKR